MIKFIFYNKRASHSILNTYNLLPVLISAGFEANIVFFFLNVNSYRFFYVNSPSFLLILYIKIR